MQRRDALKLGAGALTAGALGLAIPGRAQAQAKMMLKASDVHPEGYPTVAAVESLGKKLSAATQGRLGVQMFASMQLGDEKTAIEQAQIGAIQFARVSVGSIGPVVDALNVFNLPFLFRNTAHMQAVIDGKIGQDLLDGITNNPQSRLVGLCWMDAGARSMYDTKRSIHTIADLKGLKMRVIPNPIFVDMMNALGANAVSMGYDQVFSALQTGVIDGAENNTPSYVYDHHYEAAKHFSFTEHLIVPEIIVFSRPTWDKLAKADQDLIRKLAGEAQAEERKLWQAKEADALSKMKEAKIDIVEIADKTPFQKAVKPVWDKYGSKYADMIKRVQAVA
ncbi:MAG: TRAP transporter substrate-binding protein [Rhodospirillales bacterium]|nr:TRAP transporter substrate-binding protein [Rhodospirillales bacterium]MDE2200062.1 TRAP transporter substrate-binding protein [Rhodospirillales bacterium]MDE2576770.1 TRAP transporter substrate-binding protein [Rhodospirillales bacterium]